MRKYIIFVALFLADSLSAATHAINPANANNGDGASWAVASGSGQPGAFNAIPATLVRGDTYCLARGTYATNYAFNTATSGTSVITLLAATSGNACGSLASYNNSTMGTSSANQAIFPITGVGGLVFSTNYWTIDGGGTGNTCDWSAQTGCGIKIDGTGCNTNNFCWAVQMNGATHLTFNYIELQGMGVSNVDTHTDQNFRAVGTEGVAASGASNLAWNHVYLHDSSNYFFSFFEVDTVSINYAYLYKAGASVANHAQMIQAHMANHWTISNSVFRDPSIGSGGSAVVIVLNAGPTQTSDDWKIYDNVFMTSSGNANSSSGNGDGIIACINLDVCSNWFIYHNNFVNNQYGVSNKANVFFQNAGSGSSVTVEDNLWFQNDSAVHSTQAGVTLTQNYNCYISTTSTGDAQDCSTPVVNPFAGWPGLNFALTADTTPGLSLGSPYNVDMAGNPFSTPSMGAFQFMVVAPAPAPTMFAKKGH